MPPDQYAAPVQPTGLRSRLGILTLVLLVSVQFIVIIDTSIVNVTLPSIQRALHFSQQNLQWVLSGYVLTFGGLLLLGGRLGDLLGRRRMLVTGVLVFAVASMACGLANSQGLLIAARMVQGAGGALMAPAALSTIATTFTAGKDRNTAMGVYGAVSGIAGSALGLAILSAIATSRTQGLLAAHAPQLLALTSGYHRGLLVGSAFMAAAAVIALRTSNTKTAASPAPSAAAEPVAEAPAAGNAAARPSGEYMAAHKADVTGDA